MTFRAAFYTGTQPGIAGVYNRAVRAFESGPYSHCELIFSDGACASASFKDGGVRFKASGSIDWSNGNWALTTLPADLEPAARQWFIDHLSWDYDLRGNFRFLWPWGNRDSKNKAFCIEALLAALGVPDAWRFGVNQGAVLCQLLSDRSPRQPAATSPLHAGFFTPTSEP